MEKVTLHDERNERVSVTVYAYFDSSGNLILDGYDRGPFVEERTGDWDYEYTLKVNHEQLYRLSMCLDERPLTINQHLQVLKEKFEGPLAYSSFKSFLNSNDITFSAWSH